MNQGTSSLIMIVVLLGMMYLLMIRPENKRKKAIMEMRNSLKVGDTRSPPSAASPAPSAL